MKKQGLKTNQIKIKTLWKYGSTPHIGKYLNTDPTTIIQTTVSTLINFNAN